MTATATIEESSALDPTAPLAALHPFAPRTLEAQKTQMLFMDASIDRADRAVTAPPQLERI